MYSLAVPTALASQEETFENGDIARNIVRGNGFSSLTIVHRHAPVPTAAKPPFYPYLMAACMAVFGDSFRWALRFMQVVAMTLSIIVISRLFTRIFDLRTGALTGLLIMLNPLLAKADVNIENTAFSILFSSLFFSSLWRSLWNDGSPATAGFWAGAMLLTNPSFLAFLPFAAFAYIVTKRSSCPRAILLFLLVTGLVVAPWTARNLIVFREWIMINGNFPYNIWLGNNPQASGALAMLGGDPITIPEELISRTQGMNEVQAYREFGRIGWAYAAEHPSRFLELRIKAFLYFWITSRPWLGYGTAVDILNVGCAFLMLFTALPGFVVAACARSRGWWLWGFLFLSYSMVYSMTHADSIDRYRLPIDPYLWAFSALYLSKFGRRAPPSSI